MGHSDVRQRGDGGCLVELVWRDVEAGRVTRPSRLAYALWSTIEMTTNSRISTMTKVLLGVIGTVVILPMLYYMYRVVTWEGIYPDVEPKPFNSEDWKTWTIKDMQQSEDIRRSFQRKDMFDDLMSKHDFKGWTLEQLKDVLGEPNPEFLDKEWDVAYLVGPDFIDYQVLVFRFDKERHVSSYQVKMY
jgi:hypothetical protein